MHALRVMKFHVQKNRKRVKIQKKVKISYQYFVYNLICYTLSFTLLSVTYKTL